MNDEREILRIHSDWIELERSGKERDVLGFCCQDVVWLVPGLGALRGIEEVRRFLDDQPDTVIVSIETFDTSVEISNELAVKSANFRTTLLDNGVELSMTGTHVWTLRKNHQKGRWLVTHVAWVIDPGH